MSAAPEADRITFTPTVELTRDEVFAACQALADADRCLIGIGRAFEASALGDLFELLEDRLTGMQALPAQAPPAQVILAQA
jgi:hypothetical protein